MGAFFGIVLLTLMKIPPWLKMHSTGAEVAGTRDTIYRTDKWAQKYKLMTVFTLAFGVVDAASMCACSIQCRGTGWATNAEGLLHGIRNLEVSVFRK